MRNIYTLSTYFRWLLTISSIFYASLLLGQGYEIVGRTFDDTGKKIGPVRIVLYDQVKKQVVQIETPDNGKFKLKNIPNGKYTMNIYGPGGYSISQNITIDGGLTAW